MKKSAYLIAVIIFTSVFYTPAHSSITDTLSSVGIEIKYSDGYISDGIQTDSGETSASVSFVGTTTRIRAYSNANIVYMTDETIDIYFNFGWSSSYNGRQGYWIDTAERGMFIDYQADTDKVVSFSWNLGGNYIFPAHNVRIYDATEPLQDLLVNRDELSGLDVFILPAGDYTLRVAWGPFSINMPSPSVEDFNGNLSISFAPVDPPPTGELLYGVNSADDGLSLIDPQTGEVTFIGPLDQDTDPNFNRFSTPVAMAVRPSDQKIFVWNNTSDAANTGDLLTVDPLTGAATVFVEVSGQPSFGALAFAPDGRLFAHWNQLFEINLLTGELSPIGSVGPSVSGAAFSPDGILWCAGLVSINGQVVSQLSTVDTSTGVRSVVAELDVDVGTIGSIVFDPSGTLIGSGFNGPLGNIIFDIDTIDGSVSNIRFITNGSSPQGMGFVSSTTLPNQPPYAPELTSPDDGKVNVNPKTLVLKWDPSTDPDGDDVEYCVDIKEVVDPNDPNDDIPIETGCFYDIYYPETWFALPETLGSFTTYQWSVTARDSNGNLSPASQPRTFTTANMIYGLFVGIRYDDFSGDTSAQLLRERFDKLPGVAYTELMASNRISDSTIESRINFLKNKKLKPGDTFFLYITGHGCPAYDKVEPNQSGNEPANPPDGPVLTSEDEFIPINGNNNCGALFWDSEKLTDDELYTHLSIIEAGINKWIFIDSCDSGGFWGDPDNPNADEGDLEKLENASLCAAATETTKSYAITVPENGQMSEPLSLFAVALSDGLTFDTNGNYKIDRAPQDDNVTFTEMTSWLQDWVANVHPTWAGQIVIEMDTGDPVIFSLDMWSPFFAKTDDFVESLSVGSVNSLVADAMGPYIGVTNFPITFNASGSYDPDGQIVSYEWDFDNDGIFEVSITTPTTNFTYTTEYNGIVTLRVTNNDGIVATDTASVEVAHDTTPPKMVISASPDVLWPPNHKMTSVTVSANAIDNCGVEPTCQIISVESNEPIDGLGDGDKSPDWEITGDLTVNLRAERSDEGDGRIYTITVECTDASSNTATADVFVTVPHDKGKKK